MKRLIPLDRVLLAAIVAALAAWPLAQAATAGPAEPVVPGEIQVLEGNKVFLVGHAVGVQIYSCNVTGSVCVPRTRFGIARCVRPRCPVSYTRREQHNLWARVGCTNSVARSNRAICSGIVFVHPTRVIRSRPLRSGRTLRDP